MRNDLTADFVRSILDYDPDTGALSWNPNIPRRLGRKAGTVSRTGYIQISINNKLYLGHRLAWLHFHGEWPREYLDHINGCRSDNRIQNLREASQAENNRNRSLSSSNRSGFSGVNIRADGNIRVSIGVNGKQKHLGYFDTTEEAGRVAHEARAVQYGEFAPNALVSAARILGALDRAGNDGVGE